MTIARSIYLTLAVAAVALIAIVFPATDSTILEEFRVLEKEAMIRDLGRLSQALRVAVDQLDRRNLDWSAWDDTYDFIETADPEYAESNLVTTTLDSTGMRINFMIYVNLVGRIVAERGYDHRRGKTASVPADIYALVDSMHHTAADVGPIKGIVGTTDGLFLLSSRAILTSEIAGPSKGRLIVGRRFDQVETDRLGRITSLDATLLVAAPEWEEDAASQSVRLGTDGTVTGVLAIPDAFGKTLAAFEISRTSELYGRGLETRRLLVLYVSLTIAVIGAITILTIHRNVIRPVTEVARAAREIGTHNLKGLVPEHGPVEIAAMGASINEMLHVLRQATENLVRAERFHAVSRLSAGISHNLNNILTGVLGPAELIQNERTNEVVRHNIDIIRKAGDRATELVRRLAEAVTPSSSTSRLPIDPVESIQSAIEVTRGQWHEESIARGHRIDVSTGFASTGWATVPDGVLQNILVNLIVNAVEAQPHGGTIDISTQDRDDLVEIVVTDGGPGIDEESLTRVFEPLVTTDVTVGRGFGLAWVYTAVTDLGGTINVRSSSDGTSFILSLPGVRPLP